MYKLIIKNTNCILKETYTKIEIEYYKQDFESNGLTNLEIIKEN